jgi:LPS-assembly protein
MGKRCKVRSNNISAGLVIVIIFLITLQTNAKYFPFHFKENKSRNHQDTGRAKAKRDTLLNRSTNLASASNDTSRLQDTSVLSSRRQKDSLVRTIDTLDVKVSQDSLDAPVNYAASDSGVLYIDSKQFILYGKSNMKYTDISVDAAVINIDQDKNLIKAYGAKDTSGNPMDKPKLVQGETTSYSDTIFYNTKTQKGLTKSSYIQEGEMFIYANTVKKVDANILYAYRGRFTTCNLDTPHFAFRTRKMKIVSQKLAVTGPTAPEFEGVPVPIYIPFGIFPLNSGRHSGFLPPQFAANEDFGLGLEGLGYYKVLNDYSDVTIRSNIYSYGGWNLNIAPTYMRRYRYRGSLNLALQKTKILNKYGNVKQEFTESSTFMVSWNHSVDSKARPGTMFSASVNAGSTKFNQYLPNNTIANFQNQLSSTINYTKDWRGKYNLSLSANHSQNNLSRLIYLTLPNASFSAVTIYPFEKKDHVGTAKWYEKLGVAYNGSFQNQVAFYDSSFTLRRLLDTAQWSVQHNIPITLSLPQLGPIQISPGVSYSERWFGQAISPYFDPTTKTVQVKPVRGFFVERETNLSLSASTRIFGTYQFGKTSGIRAIRHEIRPSLSLNYKPDLNKNNYSLLQVDSNKHYLTFSNITGYQALGDRRFGGVSFSLDNLLEMKVRSKKDTSNGGIKKIRLIDGFGVSSAYNLIADSFQLSPFSLYLRSTLFEKINISANATLDPYVTDSLGFRKNQLRWQTGKFSPGRITNGSIAISTQFASKSKDGKSDKERLPEDQYMTPDEQQRQLEYVRSNPAEFTDFNIPWSVSVSYSLSFSNNFSFETGGYKTESYSNVSLNGDFSLTPRWKMGGSTYYDFKTSQIQTLTMFISREMHCWQMSINLTPIGLYRSFNVTISPKSGILRDLRVNRSRYFYGQ